MPPAILPLRLPFLSSPDTAGPSGAAAGPWMPSRRGVLAAGAALAARRAGRGSAGETSRRPSAGRRVAPGATGAGRRGAPVAGARLRAARAHAGEVPLLVLGDAIEWTAIVGIALSAPTGTASVRVQSRARPRATSPTAWAKRYKEQRLTVAPRTVDLSAEDNARY